MERFRSSFAFLPPLFAAQQGQFSYPAIMCGLAAAGVFYITLSQLIRTFGSDFLHRILPPVVTGPVIMLIGLILAPVSVHMAIGSITGKDYVEDPGIEKTMLGDGIATSLAAFLGGPPNTTYSEVSGAVALTRSFNPAIMTWAAITAILLAFVGKLGGLLNTIPTPAMGGIMLLLFGAITVIGLSTLVRAQVDLMLPRNMIIVAIIMVTGLGGMVLNVGVTDLKGIGLGAILGVILNLVLPKNNAESDS